MYKICIWNIFLNNFKILIKAILRKYSRLIYNDIYIIWCHIWKRDEASVRFEILPENTVNTLVKGPLMGYSQGKLPLTHWGHCPAVLKINILVYTMWKMHTFESFLCDLWDCCTVLFSSSFTKSQMAQLSLNCFSIGKFLTACSFVSHINLTSARSPFHKWYLSQCWLVA